MAKGKAFASVYVGDGLRQLAGPFQAPLPQPFAHEFKDDEENPQIVEQEDPTANEEQEEEENEAEQ